VNHIPLKLSIKERDLTGLFSTHFPNIERRCILQPKVIDEQKGCAMIKLELPALPSAEDKLFLTAEDWWDNACLSFLPDGWNLYATGYKEAADILVSQVEQKEGYQDMLVYPIVFLYRQYLELSIKDLIRQVRKLQDIHEPIPKIHHIDKLWRICSDLLRQIAPGDSEDELKHIERLMGEFCTVDPTSMAFRYPEDLEGNPSLPGIRHINVRNVKEIIAKIAVILDGADALIDNYLSIKADTFSNL